MQDSSLVKIFSERLKEHGFPVYIDGKGLIVVGKHSYFLEKLKKGYIVYEDGKMVKRFDRLVEALEFLKWKLSGDAILKDFPPPSVNFEFEGNGSKKGDKKLISFRLPSHIDDHLEVLVDKGVFISKSEAVRTLVKLGLVYFSENLAKLKELNSE